MKTAKRMAAQGDVIFRRLKALPDGVVDSTPKDGRVVVAHSETGHHHLIDDPAARIFERVERDPLVCYLSIDGTHADVVHHRSWDTHATIRLPKGVWEVRRQREHTPEGWRRVED